VAEGAGRLDPIDGRDSEIARVIRVLARKTKNNPVLLGEPGVGKTAIVEGLALRIANGSVPGELRDVSLFSLNLGNLLAGTGYRGDFEQRLRDLVSQLRRPGTRRLLFIDEIHLLGRAGRSEGGLDAANMLKPLLARGELPCLGASTPAEWGEMVAADPALERRFQPVHVAEPAPAQAFTMLVALRTRLEKHHHVTIADDALHVAIDRSQLLWPTRRLPDRAIDLLDEACAATRLSSASPRSAEYEQTQKNLAVAEARFDLNEVARLRYRILPQLDTHPRGVVDGEAVRTVSFQPPNGR
jgi:ATP-dependent Clp protease ATP-binding subunit ClpB